MSDARSFLLEYVHLCAWYFVIAVVVLAAAAGLGMAVGLA